MGADLGRDDISHAIRNRIPEARAAPSRIFESARRAHTTLRSPDALRASIKQGHVFKGSPHCFAHLAPQRMLATFKRQKESAEIIDAPQVCSVL